MRRLALLLTGLLSLAAARADWVDDDLAHVTNLKDRAELAAILAPLHHDRRPAWRVLVPVLLIEGYQPRDDLRPSSFGADVADWVRRHAGGLASRWLTAGRYADAADLTALAEQVLQPLPDWLRLRGGVAAARLGRPEAVRWLSNLPDEDRAEALPWLALAERRAGHLERAAELAEELPSPSPWLSAELAAAQRARAAGVPLDVRLEVPERLSVAELLAGLPQPWLQVTVRNSGARTLVASAVCELVGVAPAQRQSAVLRPGGRMVFGLTPVLGARPTLTASSWPLRISVGVDHPAATLVDTTAPLPLLPVGELGERPSASLIAATIQALPASGASDDLPTVLSGPLEPVLALGAALKRPGRRLEVLVRRQQVAIGWIGVPALGLVRANDERGLPRRPRGTPVEQPAARRLGLLPTDDGGAVELQPDRDGLQRVPGQALKPVQWRFLEPTPEGAITLSLEVDGDEFVRTPMTLDADLNALWLTPTPLRQPRLLPTRPGGLNGALVEGRALARSVLAEWAAGERLAEGWSATKPTAPGAPRRTAEPSDAAGRDLETVLAVRYGVSLTNECGVTFGADVKPVARGLNEREQEQVKRLVDAATDLAAQQWPDQALAWRLELQHAGSPLLARLTRPGADVQRAWLPVDHGIGTR